MGAIHLRGGAWFLALALTAGGQQPALRDSPSGRVGIYHWGGVSPHSVSEGIERIAALGGTVARLAISARAPSDYQMGDCTAGFSLPAALETPDLRRAFSNPRITTFLLTAYDGLTLNCDSQRYLDPSFYSPVHTAALVSEYAAFTLALLRNYPGKRFILDNWESDNAVYCGKAYAYAMDPVFRASCEGNYRALSGGIGSSADAMRGLRLWFEARADGVRQGRALAAEEGLAGGVVLVAGEINIVRALRERGLASVLYDVLPGLPLDYVSYSCYESINGPNPGGQLVQDLHTIQSILGRRVIIGEFGFPRNAYANAVALENTVVTAALGWGVDYLVAWNLFDQSETEQYGLYDRQGLPTAYAAYFSQLFHCPAGSCGWEGPGRSGAIHARRVGR